MDDGSEGVNDCLRHLAFPVFALAQDKAVRTTRAVPDEDVDIDGTAHGLEDFVSLGSAADLREDAADLVLQFLPTGGPLRENC